MEKCIRDNNVELFNQVLMSKLVSQDEKLIEEFVTIHLQLVVELERKEMIQMVISMAPVLYLIVLKYCLQYHNDNLFKELVGTVQLPLNFLVKDTVTYGDVEIVKLVINNCDKKQVPFDFTSSMNEIIKLTNNTIIIRLLIDSCSYSGSRKLFDFMYQEDI